jgi:hypothetical protein
MLSWGSNLLAYIIKFLYGFRWFGNARRRRAWPNKKEHILSKRVTRNKWLFRDDEYKVISLIKASVAN